MAQFYNPKNSFNQHINTQTLNALNKRIEQIKTRHSSYQSTDNSKVGPSPRCLHSITEVSYDNTRQRELHNDMLKRIYNQKRKPTEENTHHLSPLRTRNLTIVRRMELKKINQQNDFINERLISIRARPIQRTLKLPKINNQ